MSNLKKICYSIIISIVILISIGIILSPASVVFWLWFSVFTGGFWQAVVLAVISFLSIGLQINFLIFGLMFLVFQFSVLFSVINSDSSLSFNKILEQKSHKLSFSKWRSR